jgi:hypothetical protein
LDTFRGETVSVTGTVTLDQSVPLEFAQVVAQLVQAVSSLGEMDGLLGDERLEADLADYFGSIPHAELLKSVARRVSDRHMLHLTKMWLEAPVEEDDGGHGLRGSARRSNLTAAG